MLIWYAYIAKTKQVFLTLVHQLKQIRLGEDESVKFAQVSSRPERL